MKKNDPILTPKNMAGAYKNLANAKALAEKGQRTKAERMCQSLIVQYPTYFAAHRQLATLFIDKKQYYQAFQHISFAVNGDPGDYDSLLTMEGLLSRLGLFDAGLELNTRIEAVARANGVEKQPAMHFFNRGTLLLKTMHYSAAVVEFERCLAAHPNNYDPALKLVECYTFLGEYPKALRLIEHFLFTVGVKRISFLGLLTELPGKYLRKEIKQYISLAEQAVAENEAEETFRQFTVAKLYHANRNHGKAWTAFCRQNDRLKATIQNNYERQLRQRKDLLAWAGTVQAQGPHDAERVTGPLPLFILGPSRSGKSSLEAALAWLPGIRRGFENTLLENAVRHALNAADRLPTDFLPLLPEPLLPRFFTFYRSLFHQRANGATVFTTTTPGLVTSVPAIIQALPQSRFLFLRRDPLDTALRIYFTYYREANYHSYDLDWCLRYIQWYDAVVDLWLQKLPGAVMLVSYRQLTANPVDSLHRILDFLGVEADIPADLRIPGDCGFAEPYRQFMESNEGRTDHG